VSKSIRNFIKAKNVYKGLKRTNSTIHSWGWIEVDSGHYFKIVEWIGALEILAKDQRVKRKAEDGNWIKEIEKIATG